jgi:hypothetical protein
VVANQCHKVGASRPIPQPFGLFCAKNRYKYGVAMPHWTFRDAMDGQKDAWGICKSKTFLKYPSNKCAATDSFAKHFSTNTN